MIKKLDEITRKLKKASSIIKKIQILDEDPKVDKFLNSHFFLKQVIKDYPLQYEYILKSLIIIGQAENILYNIENTKNANALLKHLLEDLLEIDEFYESIGGIVGYHLTFLKLLIPNNLKDTKTKFYPPPYVDLTKPNKQVQELVDIGLDNLHKFALICPMGGAGDRLNLFDPKTKEPMPVGALNFQGRSLIENLIRDLQSLEYLYFKKFQKELLTPIIIMTSDEKNNHKNILSIFENNNWFDRDKNSFYFIKQPLAPLITEDGNWTLKAPLKIAMKPSGHGVLWHVMEKQKAFDFLKKMKREKALIRQINNPIANTDYLLLAFMGALMKDNRAFGFASCKSKKGLKEGLNVLKEIFERDGYLYNISNIEYTDFQKYFSDKSSESLVEYPANTNILAADLKELRKAAQKNPFPGLTINLKTKVFSKDKNEKIIERRAGRLEAMMQNISDSIQDFKKKKEDVFDLKTFLTLSDRKKTISTTKKAFKEGNTFFETPQNCFYDVLANYSDLLKNYCHMKIPDMPSIEEYLIKGPSFICDMHPMIGPLYTIIAKKIKGGELIFGSELRLEIAQVLIDNLYLNGSLIIETNLINKSNKNIYNSAICVLKNVTVKNLGIDKTANNNYSQNKIKRKEYLKIILGEESEFYANDIEFINTHEIIVPSFHKMFILRQNNKITYKVEKI